MLWLVTVLYFAFALAFPLGKILLGFSSPAFVIGSRMSLAGVIMLAYHYFFSRKKTPQLNGHDWFYLIKYMVIAFYISFITEFWAMSVGMAAAKACLLFNLAPFFTAVFAYIYFGEKLNIKKLLGLIIGFVGFLPLLMAPEALDASAGSGVGFISWPEIAQIIAVAAYTYGWILIQQLVVNRGHSSMWINAMGMLGGGLISLVHSGLTDTWPPIEYAAWASYTGWLLVMIFVANFVAYNIYSYLLHHYTATFLSFAGFMAPIFASVLGWLMLGEKVTWHFFATVVIVSAGLYIFYQQELKHISVDE